MTIARIFLIFIMIFLSFVSGCKEEAVKTAEDQQLQNIVGQLTSHTDCKSYQKSVSITDTPDTFSCIEYLYDAKSHKLNLKHINAGFNCCPDSLYCIISLRNDTIFFEEYEKMPGCHCDCLFDLNIEISGIVAKRYFLKFIEPYCGDQERLEFEVDLTTAQQGNYCVKRTRYPWGSGV